MRSSMQPQSSVGAARPAGLASGAAARAAAAVAPAGRPPPESAWGGRATVRIFRQAAMAVGEAACSAVLLFSCFLATALILSEAAQGIRRSLYCRLGVRKRLAPMACVVPLTTAAVLCNAAVVAGLLCVARFAWRSGSLGAAGSSWAEMERQRQALRSDLRTWRGASAKVLLAAGVTYLLAGAPCAGLARLAFIFLATGFLTLYATALFFDDDFENVRLSPRFLRFLGVYTLVGLTFTALNTGATERLDGKPQVPPEGVGVVAGYAPYHGRGNETDVFEPVCSSAGQRKLSPPACTVPLDLASAVSLWWAASPLFAAMLPVRGGQDVNGAGCGGQGVRRLLQRWRRHVDVALLGSTLSLLLLLDRPCRHSSPISFAYAEFGAWAVGLLSLLRRASPLSCDGWRGPLEHLAQVRGPEFSVSQCAVCLTALQRGEDVCRTPCNHDFHRDCLEEWVLSRRSRSADCPLCREPLVLREALDLTRLLL